MLLKSKKRKWQLLGGAGALAQPMSPDAWHAAFGIFASCCLWHPCTSDELQQACSHNWHGIPVWQLNVPSCDCRFRRLALKHHPDADPSEEAGKEFARICEAYDVLSNGEGCFSSSTAQ